MRRIVHEDGLSRWTVPVVAVASVVLLGWYLSPLWSEIKTWGGTFDWGYFFFLAEVDRKSILDYGQIPLWNPYYCGGSVHLASPQGFTLSPFNLFVLIFGSALGIRLMITAATLMALDGVRRWSRSLGLGPAASWVAGTSFAVSGAMAQHLGGGHIGWMAFALLPYVLWAFHRALLGEGWGIPVGGLFLAWIFFHFGVYPYPYSCLAVAVFGVAMGLVEGRILRAMGVGLGMAALSLGLAGVRLLPLYEFISKYPRRVADWDYLRLLELWEVYAVRHTARNFGTHGWVWPEYGNYYGPIGVFLVLAGLVAVTVAAVRGRRGARLLLPAAVGLGVFILFQMGNQPYLPWTYLRKLPVFENLRVPSRFTTLAGLFAAPLIGYLTDRGLALGRGAPAKRRAVVMAALFVVVLGYLADAVQFNRQQWFQTFGTPPPRDIPSPDFHQVAGSRFRMYAYPRVNRGSIDCFEESPLPISSRLRPLAGPDAQEYPKTVATGTVTRTSWSPNRIVLAVDFREPGRVLVNQNYAPDWHASVGKVVSDGGLLAVDVPAGQRELTLYYRPTSFMVGLALTILSFLLSVFLLARARAKRSNDDSRARGRAQEPE